MNLFSDIIIVCWKVSHTKWVKLLSMSPDGQLLLWLSLCQPSHVWVSRSGTIWSFTRPTGLQQNTGAADVYGLRFSPRPVLIGAPSYPCRENLYAALLLLQISLCLFLTGCHTHNTLVACHPWARNSIWRSTAFQTTTGAGEEKMMTYLTGQITFKRTLHPRMTIVIIYSPSFCSRLICWVFVCLFVCLFVFCGIHKKNCTLKKLSRFIAYNSSL